LVGLAKLASEEGRPTKVLVRRLFVKMLTESPKRRAR